MKLYADSTGKIIRLMTTNEELQRYPNALTEVKSTLQWVTVPENPPVGITGISDPPNVAYTLECDLGSNVALVQDIRANASLYSLIGTALKKSGATVTPAADTALLARRKQALTLVRAIKAYTVTGATTAKDRTQLVNLASAVAALMYEVFPEIRSAGE
jgi:hypothetical protein